MLLEVKIAIVFFAMGLICGVILQQIVDSRVK